MKKGLLLAILFVTVIFVTACGSGKSKSTRTIEDLMDQYIEAYTKPDVKLAKDLFPPFYVKYVEERNALTQEILEQALEHAKEEYGDDFRITYEITSKTKMTAEELEELNNQMASRYNAEEKASECYKYTGSITFTGSKFEDPDPIDPMKYCNYNGSWYMLSTY